MYKGTLINQKKGIVVDRPLSKVALIFCICLFGLFMGCSKFPNAIPYQPSVEQDRYKEAVREAEMAQNLKQISHERYAYRIRPTDVIEINVFDYDKMNLTTRVGVDGKITFPPLGEIQAAGLTQQELEAAIVKGLKKGYLTEPNVIVSVREATSQNMTVLGEVRSPGPQIIWGESKLVDVLAKAGGVSPIACNIAYLIRQDTEERSSSTISTAAISQTAGSVSDVTSTTLGAKTYRIYLGGLLQRGDMIWNVAIQPGDILNVPPAGTVHITGDGIEKPGTYPLTFQPLTMRELIDNAGGLKPESSHNIILARDDEAGNTHFYVINYDKAIKQNEYNVKMFAGDRLITIPSTWRKISWYIRRYLLLTATTSKSWAMGPNGTNAVNGSVGPVNTYTITPR